VASQIGQSGQIQLYSSIIFPRVLTLHFGITLPPKDPSDPDLDERGDPERPARTQSEK